MPSSFLNKSARCGPTPFKYSIGLDNMFAEEEIVYNFQTKILHTVRVNLFDQ
jgi:hypothetical protein